MDANMALSIINMKLRDFYSSKEELLEEYEDAKEMVDLLEKQGYRYDSKQNRFVK
jgi:hypothetical protein